MLAELVLVTRLLGLVNGQQPIHIQLDENVKSVDLIVDGRNVLTLAKPPWQAVLDFGPEIAPHELTTIARDADGAEVGRDRQVVNLGRPHAEAAIVLTRDGERLRATVQWQHIAEAKPKSVTLKLDGQPIGIGGVTTLLPRLEPASMHVLEAEVEFAGVTARRELVFGGRFSEEVPTELTAVLVRAHERDEKLPQCLTLDGAPLRVAAMEKPAAQVLFVRTANSVQARSELYIPNVGGASRAQINAGMYHLPATMRFVWPTARSITREEERSVVNLFLQSDALDGSRGTHFLLTRVGGPTSEKERFADAVAVAGVTSLGGAKRRAVVLVLGGQRDHSRHEGPIVRRYLERIGVPLYVWSVVKVTPQMQRDWGEVRELPNADELRRATEALRRDLDRQRIVWAPISPLEALRVEATPDCSFAPIAKARGAAR